MSTTTATITRCLSVRQPWAGLICHGYKPCENRTWATPFRGRIAIHASSGNDIDAYRQSILAEPVRLGGLEYVTAGPPLLSAANRRKMSRYMKGPKGPTPSVYLTQSAIVGSVEIVDCIQTDQFSTLGDLADALPESPGFSFPAFAWCELSDYAWLLARPLVYRSPICCYGKLNLWSLSPQLIDAVANAESAAESVVDW